MELKKISEHEYHFGDAIRMYLTGHPTQSLMGLTSILFRDGGSVSFERNPVATELVLVNPFIEKLCQKEPLYQWVCYLATKYIIPDDEDEEN
jgi:hypothetical protein